MKLFSMFQNSAGERVRIALALKDIEYEYVSVSSMGWDAYEHVNPQRLLPALEIDGTIIAQATAILEYLEECYPTPPLLPERPLLRAEVRGFAQHITSEMHAHDVIRIRRLLHHEMAVSPDAIAIWRHHWLHKGFTALEELLVRRPIDWPFCYSEQPGWADLHLIPHVHKAIARIKADMSAYPLISAIYDRCIELPAFVKAAAEQQPDYPGTLLEHNLNERESR